MSVSRSEYEPETCESSACSSEQKLRPNSPDASISSWVTECGPIEMTKRIGSTEIIMAHSQAMTFSRPSAALVIIATVVAVRLHAPRRKSREVKSSPSMAIVRASSCLGRYLEARRQHSPASIAPTAPEASRIATLRRYRQQRK